ncbi:MAG: hypothetical protein ABW217_20595 [Polyangiaceae bacterium]
MARVVCLLVVLLSACSDADRPPPPPPSNGAGTTFSRDQVANGDLRNIIEVGTCDEGDVTSCRYYSEAHGNVQSCFVGEQRCVGGTWGDCGDALEVDPADLQDDDSSESESESSSSGY